MRLSKEDIQEIAIVILLTTIVFVVFLGLLTWLIVSSGD